MNTEDLKDRVVSLIGMASDRIRVENLSCMVHDSSGVAPDVMVRQPQYLVHYLGIRGSGDEPEFSIRVTQGKAWVEKDDRYGQGDKLLAKLRRLEEVDQLRLLAGEYERDIRNGADLDRWDSLEGVDGFVRR